VEKELKVAGIASSRYFGTYKPNHVDSKMDLRNLSLHTVPILLHSRLR
jgi:hypothetical protein